MKSSDLSFDIPFGSKTISTNFDGGDVENRIKELKGALLSGKTSCHRFLANHFRLILHCAAFVLLQALRKLFAGTDFADAQVSTL